MRTAKERSDLAFEYYYEMGTERTFEKVAEHFNININTVKNYSRKYNWSDRKLLLDIEIQKKTDEKIAVNVSEIKAKYRADVNAMMAIARSEINAMLKTIKDKNLKAENITDFERLARVLERLANLDLRLISESVTDEQNNKPQVHFYIPHNNRDERDDVETLDINKLK